MRKCSSFQDRAVLLGNKIVEKAMCHFRVIPLHNTKPLHAHSLKLDITNTSEVSSLFNKFKPYAVIHTREWHSVNKLCLPFKEGVYFFFIVNYVKCL